MRMHIEFGSCVTTQCWSMKESKKNISSVIEVKAGGKVEMEKEI